MAAVKHPDYREEAERLAYTLEYVNKSLEDTATKKENIDNEVTRLKKHFNSDNSQDYIGLIINTQLQDSITLKYKNLQEAKHKPYFARLDFRENGKETEEKLYIGKMSLSRDEDQELIIIDWRAPIANLYYDGRLGKASYECPDGKIDGEIKLKRQFTIENGELNGIFDIDITTTDELLQANLGANADNRLKDIVSTIQSEQNRIIRANMWTPLIVQGAAGSGKTTIALHRIAYLIYTYEKKFDPENFMIIAPNRFFLNYISDVLPDLGVERVKQTTFEDFAMELLGKKYKVKNDSEKLTAFVENNETDRQKEWNRQVTAVSELKASIVFKEIVDEYIEAIEQSFIPKQPFRIASKVIFQYQEINNLFLNEYKRLPIVKRIHEIKKHLTSRLKIQKQEIVHHIEQECYQRVEKIKSSMEESEERQRLIIKEFDKKDELVDKIEKVAKKAVNEYVKSISRTDPFAYYKHFFEDSVRYFKIMQKKGIAESLAIFLRQYTMEVLQSGVIELEDFAPIIYLKYRIYGMDEKIPVRHIVIDEAQDFSVFQLYVLRKIVKDSSFTILGDLCQGIHAYRGTKDWGDVQKHAFGQEKCQVLTLEKSYRTTVEIMQAANQVIKSIGDGKLPLGKPVIRHGEKVQFIKKESINEIAVDVGNKIRQLKQEGFKSIAVICKTAKECKKAYAQLKKLLKTGEAPYIIKGNEKEYKSGLVIVPAYLAKGLEFDAVLIFNADAQQYKDSELDAKLLYVSMTRPLHRLYIYYCKELTCLLQN